jgi:hypothetical protein
MENRHPLIVDGKVTQAMGIDERCSQGDGSGPPQCPPENHRHQKASKNSSILPDRKRYTVNPKITLSTMFKSKASPALKPLNTTEMLELEDAFLSSKHGKLLFSYLLMRFNLDEAIARQLFVGHAYFLPRKYSHLRTISAYLLLTLFFFLGTFVSSLFGLTRRSTTHSVRSSSFSRCLFLLDAGSPSQLKSYLEAKSTLKYYRLCAFRIQPFRLSSKALRKNLIIEVSVGNFLRGIRDLFCMTTSLFSFAAHLNISLQSAAKLGILISPFMTLYLSYIEEIINHLRPVSVASASNSFASNLFFYISQKKHGILTYHWHHGSPSCGVPFFFRSIAKNIYCKHQNDIDVMSQLMANRHFILQPIEPKFSNKDLVQDLARSHQSKDLVYYTNLFASNFSYGKGSKQAISREIGCFYRDLGCKCNSLIIKLLAGGQFSRLVIKLHPRESLDDYLELIQGAKKYVNILLTQDLDTSLYYSANGFSIVQPSSVLLRVQSVTENFKVFNPDLFDNISPIYAIAASHRLDENSFI